MQGPLPNKVYNQMPDGTGYCVIGEIPIDFSVDSGAVSSVSVNSLINTFGISGVNVDTTTEGHFASQVHLPVNMENDFKGSCTVKMILDDEMDNWWTLYRYARTLKNPHDGFPEQDRTKSPYRNNVYLQRQMFVPYIEIRIGDSNLEMLNVFKFTRCYLSSLSGIDFNFTGTDMTTFTTEWTFDNIKFSRIPRDPSIPIHVAD